MKNQDLTIQKLEQENARLLALVSSQESTISSQGTTISNQHSEIEHLRQQNQLLRLARFGRKTEKFKNDDSNHIQIALQFDEIEVPEMAVPEDTETQSITYTRTKKGKGRQSLPKNLPYIEKIYDLNEEEKQCACGCALSHIGNDVTEQLDIVPQMAFRTVHIRKKYACKSCEETIKRADLPKQPIPKSIASPGLLASIIDHKFNLALPLYRQESMFSAGGVPITRATMSHWLIQCAKQLEPLLKLKKAEFDAYDIAYADETPLQVLRKEGKTPTSKSYMWLFAGGPPEKRVFLYHYADSREHQVAIEFFEEFKGYLHADAYGAYVTLGKQDHITHVACMAHARRYFADIVKLNTKKKGFANDMIALIAKLYAIEKEFKEHKTSPEIIYQTRQEKAKPILQQMKTKVEEIKPKTPPKSALGKAIKYFLSNWNALNHYLLDGRLDIDNNLSERAIKPFVIGRKNWLFHGNEPGAKAGALFYSFIATCKFHNIDPFSWFKYALTHVIHAHTIEQLEKLLPFNINPDELDNMRRIPHLIFPGVEAVN